jgi:mono/diheme cytochrome c family protein
MPGACVYCHGGTLRPLRADGSYRDNSYSDIPGDLVAGNGNGINGDTNAKLQLMEVSSFEFWGESPYTKAEQEPIIKEVNKIIYCTYPGAHASACAEYCVDPADTADCDGNGNDVAAVINCVQPIDTLDCDGNGNDLATVIATGNVVSGEWTGAFATTMSEGWYDDPDAGNGDADGIPDFDSDTFRQEYVPPGWQPDASDGIPPPGSDRLFVEVVQPVCFVCHSRRGTNLGSNTAAAGTKDIDFSTYEKFISHADLIEQYVYERGVMPLSLRGYNAFWASDGPQLLASFLPGFSHANADGSIDLPGAPVADAGPDRKVPSPVRMFGSNSRFVSDYSWSIVSTPAGGEDATLSEETTSSPILTASVDGDYVISLTVTGSEKREDQDSVLIKIDNAPVVDPKDLIFMDAGGTCLNSPEEICTIFQPVAVSPTGGDCASCHDPAGLAYVPGIPVWWLHDVDQPATGTTWYEEILARVNFNDPEQSLVLTKPADEHHYGGLRLGFEVDNPANRQNYDTMLNWIMEGAREN